MSTVCENVQHLCFYLLDSWIIFIPLFFVSGRKKRNMVTHATFLVNMLCCCFSCQIILHLFSSDRKAVSSKEIMLFTLFWGVFFTTHICKKAIYQYFKSINLLKHINVSYIEK